MAASDYDVVVIGSGFGGSVAALRAAEKGYRVGVMENEMHESGRLRARRVRVRAGVSSNNSVTTEKAIDSPVVTTASPSPIAL
jgi:choline dehydrogenase-like flavoprotein